MDKQELTEEIAQLRAQLIQARIDTNYLYSVVQWALDRARDTGDGPAVGVLTTVLSQVQRSQE